jgi:hypothetical protein
MLFIAAALLFISFIALAFVGISEARVGVRRMEYAADNQSTAMAEAFGSYTIADREAEALAEARFSASLLSLSKAHLQAQHGSPEHVHDESSSSVLIPLTQSKNPVPES